MHAVIFFTFLGFCLAGDIPTESQSNSAALAVSQFTVDLLKKISDGEKNIFLSGYSISVALGLTSLGARENTLKEIDRTFHFDKVNENDPYGIHKVFKQLIELYSQENSNYTLSTANRLFSKDNFQVKRKFQNDAEKYYHAKLQQIDFSKGGAEDIINQWVADQTHDKIKDLFQPGSLAEDVQLVLVNAIYFKGNWAKQFKKESTTDATFHVTKTKDVTVKMMKQTNHFNYYYDTALKVKVLELPYEGKDLSMFIFLPDAIDGLTEFVEQLTAEKLSELTSKVRDTNVEVRIPKFKLETEYSLIDVLRNMGLNDLFDDKANLTGISAGSMMVSKVQHKAFINVDEEGTEAAAATGVAAVRYSMPNTFDFIVDHSFFVTIVDKRKSNLILFSGAVYNI